jgi:hypothetical protein
MRRGIVCIFSVSVVSISSPHSPILHFAPHYTLNSTVPYLYFLPCLGVGGLQVKGVESKITGGSAILDLREGEGDEEWRRVRGSNEVEFRSGEE